jgi:hypothetical protein
MPLDWCSPSSPPGVVATSTVVVELREQLLTRERELESKEGVIAAWEDGLAAFEHALRRVRSKRDTSRV